MTNRQVVAKLRELGHDVEIYQRKDGSIRVTSIDGKKYKSNLSEGVEAARKILFKESLSKEEREAEAEVRRQQWKQRDIAGKLSRSSSAFGKQSESIQEEFKDLERAIKKRNRQLKKAGKRTLPVPTWSKTVATALKAGISPYIQFLRFKDWIQPLTGEIAPQEMVQSLLDDIEEKGEKNKDIFYIQDTVEDNRFVLDVYAVKKAISWVYGMGKGVAQSMTKEEMKDELLNTRHLD